MIWPAKLALLSAILFMLSFLIGYPVCYAFLGPLIMQKRGKRKVADNYSYFGNILQMENDLKELAQQNDRDAIRVLKTINICKWSIIISLISMAVFTYIGVNRES